VKGIRKYKDSDYSMIASWYASRARQCPSRASLSDMGYIADGRVAGWLYITPSNVALIEGIIAAPDTVPSLRQESLHKLSGFLVDFALALGYTNIVAITEHPSISKVCERLGFREQAYKVYTLQADE
jgi:hypothetical protein